MCSRISEQHLDRFLSLLQNSLQQQFHAGDPLDEAVTFGSLTKGQHQEKVSRAIRTARQQQKDRQDIRLALLLAVKDVDPAAAVSSLHLPLSRNPYGLKQS
jgi:acyl-CoA reductase-like NAD-dependent aldehyde dehydrogenase